MVDRIGRMTCAAVCCAAYACDGCAFEMLASPTGAHQVCAVIVHWLCARCIYIFAKKRGSFSGYALLVVDFVRGYTEPPSCFWLTFYNPSQARGKGPSEHWCSFESSVAPGKSSIGPPTTVLCKIFVSQKSSTNAVTDYIHNNGSLKSLPTTSSASSAQQPDNLAIDDLPSIKQPAAPRT